ncbi:MAG: tRNA 2-selenouridine(34) synthase MnmH [Pseudomonadota bacterium]
MNLKIEEVDFFGAQTQFKSRDIALLDLRAPVEFVKGSIPTAVNLPLFSDKERAEIGTIYKQVGKSEAVERGVEIFSEKCEAFLNQVLGLVNAKQEIALYCARGGLRSSFVATFLKAIGLKVFQLRGGYKYFRSQVQTELDLFAAHPKLVLIGMTGSGKTEVLEHLRGCPVIDFEGLAGHRGSALGGMAQKFPPATQQNFENLIAFHYSRIKKSALILVEHETSLGDVILPTALRLSLKLGKMVLLKRSFEDRVSSITKVYFSNFTESEFEKFEASINLFKNQILPTTKQLLIALARERKFSELTEILLRERYDKTYQKFLTHSEPNIVKTLDLSADFQESIQWIKLQL